jgi:hypothetical protein
MARSMTGIVDDPGRSIKRLLKSHFPNTGKKETPEAVS